MSYILFKVKRKLVYHRKIYSLLLLEITVAVACIVFAFQYYFYGMEESEKRRQLSRIKNWSYRSRRQICRGLPSGRIRKI